MIKQLHLNQWISCLIVLITMQLFAEKIHYDFTNEPIDVVIPCAPSDQSTLNRCIEGIRKNGKGIRRIIVVSPEKLTDQAEWFDEKDYPFQKKDICLALFHGDETKANEYVAGYNRMNWIYQQFLKLYANRTIPGISSNVLILDADTFFLNPVEFMTSSGFPLFAVGGEYMEPYFDHMKHLLPEINRQMDYSGITHHMLFQRCVLEDLFQTIESIHKMPAWQAIAGSIQELYWACMSEYEIYFNFIFSKSDQPQVRHLKWQNSELIGILDTCAQEGYAYVSCHGWMRKD